MYAPYGFGRSLPKAVKTLLIANAVVFVVTLFLPFGVSYLGRYSSGWNILFGLVPALVNQKLMIWQFFTYMFLHSGFGHILFNMFALWMFGTELEYNWGSRDFIKYYIACGIGGGLLVWITSMLGFSSYYIPTIGASGAIFGLLVAYGMMWPDRLIFVFGVLPMKALHFVMIFGALDLMQGLSKSGSGIAYFCHVGGGLTGFVYLKYGWRIMVHLENQINKLKSRRFKIIKGGKKSGSGSASHENHPDFNNEIDRILDKIAREGMDSISDREKRILDRASGNKQ